MVLTYPWFLLGLLALAVPLFIHLFELRKPQRVAFTNVGFIREVKLLTSRQRKVKRLLILLCRLGFVSLLVLMFCQPFIPAVEQRATGNGSIGVVLDTSASMQALGSDEQSVFEQAIKQARNLPNAYGAATRFALNNAHTSLTANAFQQAAEQLSPTANGSSAGALVARQQNSKENISHIFVFSDFQKNSFSRSDISALDSSKQVFLVPLASAPTPNVYVDSVWVEDAFVRSAVNLPLHIRLKNGGSAPAENCRVKLLVGGQQAATFQTTVGSGQTITATAQIRLANTQLQQCQVSIEDFLVTFDNAYFFTLQASPQIRVLDIAATAQPATQRLYANEALFAYRGTSMAQLQYGQLTSANLILLQELPQLDAGLRSSIRNVVQQGGSVVIVPPASAAGRPSYIQLFQELGLNSIQWEPVSASGPVLREVAMPDLRNPFFQEVFTGPTRQAVLPKAAPVLRWSRSGNEILRLRDGDGYLAQFASGRGSVYVFAAPFNAAYSDFTSQALFVPVMYRLAMQSYRRAEQPAYRLNQPLVSLAVPDSPDRAADQVFKLVHDSLTFIPTQRVVDGTLQLEIPAAMRTPGFYSLTHNGRAVTTLAFNVDKRESELAGYTAAELQQLIGPNRPNVHVYNAANGESVAARYQTEQVGVPLWRYCLWAALAFLLAEVLLIRLLGRTPTDKVGRPAVAA